MNRESVLKEITEKSRVYTIKIMGSRKDKAGAFYILMNSQPLFSNEKNVYHGITKQTLNLLKKAGIDFEVLS
jgi:hypothetical protein